MDLENSIADAPEDLPPASLPPGTSPAHGDASIVVIDDEPLSTAALTDFLRDTGYARVASLSGRVIGTQAVRDEQPDLVLLELALHQTDPFELMRQMRSDRVLRHVPVIVLTAQDGLANRLSALELGAADYLVKPVHAGELALRLHNTLASKAHRDQLAHTDHLTGLPNRNMLSWRLDWALKHALRYGSVGAVLQFGLDRFKQVNEALGPAVGDELLHAVAQRLVTGLRDGDIVASIRNSGAPALLSRSGGDEFTVLLPVIERAEDAAVVAQRMIARIAEPFAVAGNELFLSCRVGVAVFPLDSADRDTVLQYASVAMQHVRRVGSPVGGGFQFYSAKLNARSSHRLALEGELHHALDRSEFRLHYQPQVDACSGQLCGAEALVRWRHPQRGLLGPGEFIAVVEEAGLIGRLGNWVLREALRQLALWRRNGLDMPQIAVNVSSLQLQRNDFFESVRDALAGAGVAAPGLCLELTESAIIESGPQVTSTLQSIRQLGVHLALDDFGTGYSSLTYLRQFPLDELKIDRSFVKDCDSDANSAAITGAIIAMAHRLGLRVVAEGVETQEQLEFVRASGADRYQGYLFSRPVPAAEFGALLARSSPARGPGDLVLELAGSDPAGPDANFGAR